MPPAGGGAVAAAQGGGGEAASLSLSLILSLSLSRTHAHHPQAVMLSQRLKEAVAKQEELEELLEERGVAQVFLCV